jgi:hypothetical protein
VEAASNPAKKRRAPSISAAYAGIAIKPQSWSSKLVVEDGRLVA